MGTTTTKLNDAETVIDNILLLSRLQLPKQYVSPLLERLTVESLGVSEDESD